MVGKVALIARPRPYTGSRNLSKPYSKILSTNSYSFLFILEWWLVLVWMIFSAASYAIVVAALIEVARMDVIYGWSIGPQAY